MKSGYTVEARQKLVSTYQDFLKIPDDRTRKEIKRLRSEARSHGQILVSAIDVVQPDNSRVPSVNDLTRMYVSYILIHMKTTLNIDDDLLRRAALLTGVTEKTSLVRMGLEALVARQSAERLAELAGTEGRLKPIRRRRPRRVA